MPRRFANTDISPLQLRPLLRSTLLPGERLIAWGVGNQHPYASTTLFQMAMTALPLVGFALSAAVSPPRRRLLLLTDLRLLILSADARDLRRPGAGIMLDAELGGLRVKVGTLGMSYEITPADHLPCSLGIDPKQSRPAERLCFALTMMDPQRADAVARLMPGTEPQISPGQFDGAALADPPIFTDPSLDAASPISELSTVTQRRANPWRRSVS